MAGTKYNGIRVDVTPNDPAEEQPIIGLIGMGAMGKTPKQLGIPGDYRINGGGMFMVIR